ncbi:LacI family DNA-binding transcriptional regulator [Arthrobacter sp. VKM Ac-2550]|uniref:LacI family DNA-binding transcriptional regulator n=1 Tax=Crystallibacter permensis TaxID=1938888 RepID=UPI0022263F33|nr:LacI family DNA-binding transcriptional regulator [Arthrobacter sp. VKM Ac-2550]MCW2130874.1 transcriptional regulator, LacI family [Arthrobacter sp. VKM Ac-2550]
MPKKPTLVDVSAASGLSVYTVSRALNNAGGVSKASREAVLRTAREMGYVPNRAAQQLRRNTSASVTVMTASTSNYYYIDMMSGVQQVLRASGRSAVVADLATDGVYSAEAENAIVQDIIQARTAGVVSTLILSLDNVRLLESWGIPVVFVDSSPPKGVRDAASVTTDNYAASLAVGNHLGEHGYEDWALLMYPSRWSTRAERQRGITAAAANTGARLTVIECENDPDSAARALSAHLAANGSKPPRAVIAGNNPLLRGALDVLHGHGIRVPDEVALVAFDEFPWAPFVNPPMTVLNEDSKHIGEIAATILTRLIDEQAETAGNGEATPRYRPEDRREVGSNLIIRRSCGCVPLNLEQSDKGAL